MARVILLLVHYVVYLNVWKNTVSASLYGGVVVSCNLDGLFFLGSIL